MRMSDEEYAEKFLLENPPPEGVDPSDWLRDNPPPEEESDNPEAYWPVDEYGEKIPMREWTVSDMGGFPDSMRDWLIRELRKEYGKDTPGTKLLMETMPSEIAEDPSWANERLGEIARKMGIRAEYRG